MDTETAPPLSLALAKPKAILPVGWNLDEIIELHQQWLDSSGESGQQANWPDVQLVSADLTDADLQFAILDRANLQGADLLLADLRGASLLQARIQNTNLLGTKLQGANLQGASFEGANSILIGQLAGSNLFEAALPSSISIHGTLEQAVGVMRRAVWPLVSMLILCAFTWLRIATTRDVQLITNASALPWSPAYKGLPLVPFYLFAPVLLLSLHVAFHLYLQRAWEALAAMPAILPDGQRLDLCLPWFARWAVRKRFVWLLDRKQPSWWLEQAAAMLLLYWVVPATMLLFWARALTLQDLRSSMLHVLVVAASITAALYFPQAVEQAFQTVPLRPFATIQGSSRKKVQKLAAFVGSIALVLILLSVGIIFGAPHDYKQLAESSAPPANSWAADILWMLGYDPYPQIAESSMSTKPRNWAGQPEAIPDVEPANLNQLNLRYLQGYRAFFVKAHLWMADLDHAYLAETDLRQAVLRRATLRYAVLDRAQMNGAVLQQADMQNAILIQADLRDANLSFASLAGISALDARFDGASLYRADLSNASLQRASFERADLREAKLAGVDLHFSNLREAIMDSAKLPGARLEGAQLHRAMLLDADLRGSDLRGAIFQGAVLRGADLRNANLEGADLRGALGLTATQLCGAANLHDVQLDDVLRIELQFSCSTPY